MSIVYYLILALHILACFFLIGVVLLQQGKGQDLASAFGGGGSQTAFGPRGSANILSRATTILAGVFMLTSLGLSIIRPHESSILDQVPATAEESAPATTLPAARTEATQPAAATASEGGAEPAAEEPAPAAEDGAQPE